MCIYDRSLDKRIQDEWTLIGQTKLERADFLGFGQEKLQTMWNLALACIRNQDTCNKRNVFQRVFIFNYVCSDHNFDHNRNSVSKVLRMDAQHNSQRPKQFGAPHPLQAQDRVSSWRGVGRVVTTAIIIENRLAMVCTSRSECILLMEVILTIWPVSQGWNKYPCSRIKGIGRGRRTCSV